MIDRLRIDCGDCREILSSYPEGVAQCCVTSPPYWGLRDYGTAEWEGGQAECEHSGRKNHGHDADVGDRNESGNAFRNSGRYVNQGRATLQVCSCGARRIDSQLGLEATPEAYIANMVAVFRAVWRVLRNDGTLWLNLGDSYAAGTQGLNDGGYNGNGNFHGQPRHDATKPAQRKPPTGLKPKDLCGIPWRLALALQADGWYLRSDIIWHKPNPMPESVTDRPTKAHEYIFLLTKAERYFYDADAIKEALQTEAHAPGNKICGRIGGIDNCVTQNDRVWGESGMRNKRSVWTIATQPYAEAHFATFPEELPKLCILAGSRIGDTVLDPFAGSGTTGKVAIELGRRAILIELNPAYIELARARTFTTPGFL